MMKQNKALTSVVSYPERGREETIATAATAPQN